MHHSDLSSHQFAIAVKFGRDVAGQADEIDTGTLFTVKGRLDQSRNPTTGISHLRLGRIAFRSRPFDKTQTRIGRAQIPGRARGRKPRTRIAPCLKSTIPFPPGPFPSPSSATTWKHLAKSSMNPADSSPSGGIPRRLFSSPSSRIFSIKPTPSTSSSLPALTVSSAHCFGKSKMTVGFHCQDSTIIVPEPA